MTFVPLNTQNVKLVNFKKYVYVKWGCLSYSEEIGHMMAQKSFI